MKSATYELNFDGEILQRGFWLYVWEVTTGERGKYYYVGRTGDSSSTNAQSPFNRMGQHFSSNPLQNMLRNHLVSKDIDAQKCDFRLVAYGPILEEAGTKDEHHKRRDIIAALEKQLADTFKNAGYDVLNTVISKKKPDPQIWEEVLKEFAVHFPKLDKAADGRKTKA